MLLKTYDPPTFLLEQALFVETIMSFLDKASAITDALCSFMTKFKINGDLSFIGRIEISGIFSNSSI